MEINHLKEFVVLAQTGNFLEAAEKLFTSQSALSKHIKKMETELGIPLFERTTRKVKLSRFGEIYLPFAKQIVGLDNQSTALIQSSLETDQEILTLGSIPALAQYGITDLLVRFKKTRSQSTLNVVQSNSEELIDMLLNNKCELAFIRFTGSANTDLITLPYAEDTLAAVFPISHTLAEQTSISLKQLADENFLLIKKDTMLYQLAMDVCSREGFTPKVTYTDHHLENLIELVIQGMGVALLMKPLALYVNNPNIKVVDISPEVRTRIDLCYKKNAELSDAAKYFISILNDKIGE